MSGARRVVDSPTIGKTLTKSELSADLDLDLGDLSEDEQEALNDYLAETGSDGVWLANTYDEEFRRLLESSCSVGSLGVGGFGGASLGSDRFHSVRGPQAALGSGCDGNTDLDAVRHGEARRIHTLRKRGVLDDDDVSQLLDVIDDMVDVTSNDVHYALWSVRRLHEMEGQNVNDFQTARQANIDTGEESPPFTPGTIVTKFEVDGESPFKRVVRKGRSDNPEGRYMVLNEDSLAKRSYDPDTIEDELALPSTPYYAYDVKVPTGTNMKYGRVNSNFGEDGGGN